MINLHLHAQHYIELPADNSLMLFRPPRVFKAIPDKDDPKHFLQMLTLRKSRPIERFVAVDRVLACDGPARNLTKHQYVELLYTLKPDMPMPKGCDRDILGLIESIKENHLKTVSRSCLRVEHNSDDSDGDDSDEANFALEASQALLFCTIV